MLRFKLPASILLIVSSSLIPGITVFAGDGMFRGNPQHTGVYNTSGPRQLKEIVWRFKTGGKIFSSPIPCQGVVYFGSEDRCLYAVDMETGREKWKFVTGGAVNSSPAVFADLVFFGSFDGYFYAVDARTGLEKWKFQTGGEKRFEAAGLFGLKPANIMMSDPWDTFLSSPVVDDSTVFFGSGDGSLYALDIENGRLKWKFDTGGVVHSSPAVSGGVVYCGSWDGFLYAVEAGTGKEKWRFRTGKDPENHLMEGIQSSPAVADGLVCFGSRDAHLYALDAATGDEKWAFSTEPSWVVASPAISNGVVYFGTSDSARLLALDLASGKLKFEFGAKLFIFSSPAVADKTVYFGSFNGRLYALDTGTGDKLWEFRTGAAEIDSLKVLSPDGSLNRESFQGLGDDYQGMVSFVEKLCTAGSVLSSPAVSGGVVYFGSTDGYLYALR